MRIRNCLIAAILLALALPGSASTTGLNNIPTADVAPRGVLVFQQFTNLGMRQSFVYTGGFKVGAARNLELGGDTRLARSNLNAPAVGVSGAGGAPTRTVLQAKYRFQLRDPNLALGVGIANVGADARTAGHPAYYSVLSARLGDGHGHFGVQHQVRNDAVFLGYDYKVGANTTLRTDLVHGLSSGSGSLGSVGFISEVSKRFLIEGWTSFPSQRGVHETFTLKFNYVVNLG